MKVNLSIINFGISLLNIIVWYIFNTIETKSDKIILGVLFILTVPLLLSSIFSLFVFKNGDVRTLSATNIVLNIILMMANAFLLFLLLILHLHLF